MRIGFIGAGKVGTAFGIYLKRKGFQIAGYYNRTQPSGLRSAAMTDSKFYPDMTQLLGESDIVFITVTDDQIEAVCNQLCQTSTLRVGQIIAHMSGALPSTILSPAKAHGCSICSLHPLLAFADIEKAAADLSKAYFCFEGDEDKLNILKEILHTCGNPYFTLKAEQKSLYHAAACMLSNYLVTLVHNGIKLMESIHIDEATALQAMLPLMNCTIENITKLSSENALTGPISRGDTNTVAKQFEAIRTLAPELLGFYLDISEETLKLAKSAKLESASDAEKIKALIDSYKQEVKPE